MLRFTLFNAITLFILLLTVLMLVLRVKHQRKTNWALLYYLVIAGYTFAFSGSLNRWWLLAGVLCALAQRLETARARMPAVVRAVEMLFFGYVVLRCVELVLMWPW